MPRTAATWGTACYVGRLNTELPAYCECQLPVLENKLESWMAVPWRESLCCCLIACLVGIKLTLSCRLPGASTSRARALPIFVPTSGVRSWLPRRLRLSKAAAREKQQHPWLSSRVRHELWRSKLVTKRNQQTQNLAIPTVPGGPNFLLFLLMETKVFISVVHNFYSRGPQHGVICHK